VRAIYEALGAHAHVRLIGVRVEQLSRGDDQRLSLWDEDGGWRDAERTIDGVAERFGRAALRPASLLGERPHSRRDDRGTAAGERDADR
jgi:DNA polymerase-4